MSGAQHAPGGSHGGDRRRCQLLCESVLPSWWHGGRGLLLPWRKLCPNKDSKFWQGHPSEMSWRECSLPSQPARCTASSNFRNWSQLTGTQATGRRLGDRARLSAAGGPALRGRLLCTRSLGAAVPGVGPRPGSSARRQRPRLHGAAPTERRAAAHPGGRVGAPVRAPRSEGIAPPQAARPQGSRAL